MKQNCRAMFSPYMEWAKTTFTANVPYSLTNSGVMGLTLKELGASIEDIEINGPSYYGYPPLQRALARYCGAPEDCLVAATGTSMANYLAMAAVVEPGDEVLIERPTYDPILAVASNLGAEVRRFERWFDVDVAAVERAMSPRTRLVALTNLHNPTSAFTQPSVMADLAELTRARGAYLLVDEVYLPALFQRTPPSAFHLGEHVLVTVSLTKAYGLSGLRCGWVLARPDLARRMWRLNDLFGVIPAHAAERLSVIALERIEQIAARSKALLDTNRGLLHEFLDASPRLEGGRVEAGTVSFPRLRDGDVDELCRLLRERYETAVVPGSMFEAPEHFRIGFGCATETLRGGLERLSLALARL